VLNAMNRYKAVEIRVGRDYGISKIWLVQRIEILNEQIRRSSTGGSGRTRGGGGDG